MTSETLIHNIVLWVLSADTKEECVERFEAVVNNPKLNAFIKDYQNRRLICDEIIARYTIDRIDVNGNYDPSNCRWTDWITQMNNTRRNKNYGK